MTVKLFLSFIAFRITNVFLIQSQFDPDEYWQNLEPAYCYAFGGGSILEDDNDDFSCTGLTWEWKRRSQSQREVSALSDENQYWVDQIIDSFTFGLEGPVRSFTSILPTLLFYAVIKKLRWDTSWMVSRGPLFINSIFVAALTDLTVWYTSQMMKPKIKGHSSDTSSKKESNDGTVFWCVYCQLSSWFNAYTLIRTYSNSLETLMLSLSFALVSPVFLSKNEKRIASKTSTVRAWLAFFIGGICVSIRFTCLTAYIPMGIILGYQTNNMFNYVFFVCGISGLLGFLSTVVLDRAIFGVWVLPVLGNFHFNVIEGNGSLYGTHPFYWYFVIGVPAMTGLLFPVLISDLLCGPWDRATRNLWIIIGSYVVVHSFSDHKEFRFLLPVLPMMCLICGSRIQDLTIDMRPTMRKRIIFTYAVTNLLAVLYLGLIHQRAPIQVNRAILKAVAMTEDTGPIHVHYLMGCHSTPLLSHLHYPTRRIAPWYLDCSPECRKDPDIECESELFSNDPNTFLRSTYFECDDRHENYDSTCSLTGKAPAHFRGVPDYLICDAKDLPKIKYTLSDMGVNEIGRFMNGIKKIRVWNERIDGKAFNNLVSFEYDEIVLLERSKYR